MSIKVSIVPVTAYQQNCSILRCEETGRGAVFDPGGDVERILEAVRQMDVTLEKIILTHGHMDHCAASEVLHCPGHTPGHVVLFHRAQKLAWVGDVLFQGSIGRTDFPRGNHDELIRSIREKLFPLGDAVTFIPGHGPTSTLGRERQSNPFVADARYG